MDDRQHKEVFKKRCKLTKHFYEDGQRKSLQYVLKKFSKLK